VLLPLFPPETRGHSMLGCALLIALLALLAAPRIATRRGAGWLAGAAVLAVPWAWSAVAPGEVVEPLAIGLLGATCGVAVATLPQDGRRGGALAWGLAVAGGLVSCWAVAQALWGLEAAAGALERYPLLPDQDAILARLREGRAFAAFATPASLGSFLALALPLTVAHGWAQAGRRRLLLGLAAIEAAGIVAAASATALAALLGAVALYGIVRGGRRAALLAAVGLVAALAAVVAIRGPALLDPAHENNPWRLRAGNFRIAIEVWADHPWLGVGPGGYGEVYPAYRRPGDNEARHAHNLPLELAAETGTAAGAALSLLFFWAFLGPLIRGDRLRGWRLGAAVGLAAFGLHNLADFTAFLPSMLWLAAAVRGALGTEWLPARDAFSRPRLAAVLTVVLTGAAVCALGGLARERRFAAVQAVAAGRTDDAVRQGRAAVRLAPWSVDGRLLEAQLALDRAGADEESGRRALAIADQAVRLSPVRPVARAVRARARARTGDLPGAFADLCEAARLYPQAERYVRERDALAARLPLGGGTP